MAQLLPGGGVPRVHGARSPVPPWLPLFGTSRSVRQQGSSRLPTALPPYCLVAPGAGAAGPVLLACCQWDLHGSARRLPSHGAGAWRSAPLLPWRVQCPIGVCAALAVGQGGQGRRRISSLYLTPRRPSLAPLAPCVARCPIQVSLHPALLIRHSKRSLLSASSGRLPVCCALCVCCVYERSRSRGLRVCPLLSLARAHFAWPLRKALVGQFQAVRAPPCFLLWSCALPVSFWGGGQPSSCVSLRGCRRRAPLRCGRPALCTSSSGGGTWPCRRAVPRGAWLPALVRAGRRAGVSVCAPAPGARRRGVACGGAARP